MRGVAVLFPLCAFIASILVIDFSSVYKNGWLFLLFLRCPLPFICLLFGVDYDMDI